MVAAAYGSGGEADGEGAVAPEDQLQYAALFLIAPALGAVAFPALLGLCRAGPPGGPMCLAVIVARRLYISGLALLGVIVSARRSRGLPDPLGERLELLTAEFLRVGETPKFLEAEEARLTELDDLSEEQQALALPVLLAVALAISAAFLSAPQTPPDSLKAAMAGAAGLASVAVLLSNAFLCVVATKVELSAALAAGGIFGAEAGEGGAVARQRRDLAAFGLAAVLVAAAFYLPLPLVWPAQNIVNLCVAVAGARALALPRVSALALLLLGVAVYDVLGTLGPLLLSKAAAVLGMGGGSVGVPASAMERVALAKLGAGGGAAASAGLLPEWRPGVLEVVLGSRPSDILGLADITFPAALAGWALRQDQQPGASNGGWGYFAAAIAGYAAGCAACEVAGPLLGLPGLPALALLVPLMLLSVGMTAAWRGEFSELWSGTR